MTYQEALALVKSEFSTRRDADHVEVIRTGMTYDGCHGFCVAVYNYGDRVVLTDMGQTKDFFFEVADEEWVSLCEENGFAFNRWRIEHALDSIDDVYAYINFLDMISDKFFELED